MEFDIDEFVNSNAQNVKLSSEGDIYAVQDEFIDKLGLHTTQVNDDAFPVLVFVDNSKPVAWVDLENAVGYAHNGR